MNKTERDKMRSFINGFVIERNTLDMARVYLPTLTQLVQGTAVLLDYVDALEAAVERTHDIAGIMSSSGGREIFMILSEALAKGK